MSAMEALGSDDSPTDLALRLDYDINHILVDEYQDVSESQHRFLLELTRAWSLEDSKSIFLVGDPMQSIYGFRNAQVGLFIKTFHKKSFGSISLKSIQLDVNFRSEQGLIDWFNKSFKLVFPKTE